jgi:hypothetical protein
LPVAEAEGFGDAAGLVADGEGDPLGCAVGTGCLDGRLVGAQLPCTL